MNLGNLVRKEIYLLFPVMLLPFFFAVLGKIVGGVAGGILVATMSTGGWAYAIVVAGFLFWARKKSYEEIQKAALWIPLVFSLTLIPFVFIDHISRPWVTFEAITFKDLLFVFFGYFIYGLVFGLLYVCMGKFLYKKLWGM